MTTRRFPALRFSAAFFLIPFLTLTVPQLSAQAARGIFVTPIPHVPFSGTVAVERSVRQANGSTLQLSATHAIARDNEGRIRNEFRPLAPAMPGMMPAPVTVAHIYDPQNRMNAYLYPLQKTYRMTILNRPPATDTVDDYASPGAQGLPPSEFTRQDDLGYRTIAGLQAHGVRMTQTLPAEASGTGTEITVTDEYWYSEDLRINLMVRHTDSRTGSYTAKVTAINRTDPPAGLFAVPADYRMAEMTK